MNGWTKHVRLRSRPSRRKPNNHESGTLATVALIDRGSHCLIHPRRQFLLTATMTTAGALLPAPLRAAAMQSTSADGAAVSSKRLDAGWEFRQGPLDGIWEIWRTEDDDLWQSASLPHCFNAADACDPDQPYYRGQGWYRTRLALNNPFPDGRTVLHFQGAGQTTTLWVGSTLIGTHKGGYDEFVFDITDAVQRVAGRGRERRSANRSPMRQLTRPRSRPLRPQRFLPVRRPLPPCEPGLSAWRLRWMPSTSFPRSLPTGAHRSR